MNKFIIFATTLLGLQSLVAYGEEFIVNSYPDQATVFIMNAKTGVEVKLGTTPVKMPTSKLIEYTKERVFVLVARKHGHEDYRILMSNIDSSDVELNIKLNVDKDIERVRKLDSLVNSMFEAQRLIRIKNYDQALALLNKETTDHPQFSIIHELMGSTYYLKKDFRSALGSYRKAFSLNPENVEAYRMKIYLEKIFNVDKVTSK